MQLIDVLTKHHFAVFPVDVTKKPPLLPGEIPPNGKRLRWKRYQTRAPSPEEVLRWERTFKPAGWAIICGPISRIVILDFDGESGKAIMDRLGLRPHVRTGSGGYHVYFKHPGWRVPTLNSKSKESLGKKYPGVDVRGDGGYAVFFGHNEDGEYSQLRDFDALESIEILPADPARIARSSASTWYPTSQRKTPGKETGGYPTTRCGL
jgi:hypothetical protein